MSPMNPFPRYHSGPESPRRPGSGYIPGASSRGGASVSSCPHCHIAVRATDKHCPHCGWLLANNGSANTAETMGHVKDEFPTIPSQPRSESPYRQEAPLAPPDESAYSCPICKTSNKFKSGRCLICGYIGIMLSATPGQPERDHNTSSPAGKVTHSGGYFPQPSKHDEFDKPGPGTFPASSPSPETQFRRTPAQPPLENSTSLENRAAGSTPPPPRFDSAHRMAGVGHTPTTLPKDITAGYGQKPIDSKNAGPAMPLKESDSISAFTQKPVAAPPPASKSNGGIKVSLGPVIPASSVPNPPPPRPFKRAETAAAAAQNLDTSGGPAKAPQQAGAPYNDRGFERERPAAAAAPYKRSLAVESGPSVSPWKGHGGAERLPARYVLPALRTLGLVVVFGLIVFGIVKYAVPWAQDLDLSSPANVAETVPLAIENIATLSVTDSSATITWETSEEAAGRVAYGTSADYESTTALSEELTTSHQVTLSGLDPDTAYYYMIESINADGQAESIANQTFVTMAPVDSTPPFISEVTYTDISDISAVIEWTTDEEATTQVAYGTSTDYGQLTAASEELATVHSVTIRGLEPETNYYFQILSADANQNEATHQATEPIMTAQAVPVKAEQGYRAPDFTLTTYDGDSVTLSDYRGKIVLLNFWTLSCGACKAEMPFLQAAHEAGYESEMVIIAVNPRDNADQIDSYAQENGITFLIPQDHTKEIAGDYHITAIPRTFFIDTKGLIRKDQTGRFKSETDIEKILNSYDW